MFQNFDSSYLRVVFNRYFLVVFILIFILISFGISYFHYFYKVSHVRKHSYLLFALRAGSIFLLFVLLYNPTFQNDIIVEEKPVLNILVDDSKSISFFDQQNQVRSVLSQLNSSSKLQEKFDINVIAFGATTKYSDSLQFQQEQTNIYEAVEQVNDITRNLNAATVLLSDGIQTYGSAYEFYKWKQAIYPVLFGDTTVFEDVGITNINVNKYSYLKNQFPVEVLLNYKGETNQELRFTISQGSKTVFSKEVSFSKERNSATITANLEATAEGIQYYDVQVSNLLNERNQKNNLSSFVIEVIDQKSKIAILSSVLHPDLGSLKNAIESNSEREVTIFINDFEDVVFSEYSAFILYQPTQILSEAFKKIKDENFLVITGIKTDWAFMNTLSIGVTKNAIKSTEYFNPIYNPSFFTFYQDDIDFGNFPPLEDQFGEVTVVKKSDNLLQQSINGIQTQQPLLSFVREDNQQIGILLGEGIWKWRATTYRRTNSFQEFDAFIGNIIQLLTQKEKRNRLKVILDAEYSSNEAIPIKAYYTDKNYRFDNRANVELTVTNQDTKEKNIVPFSTATNVYQVKLEGLAPGLYTYEVKVQNQNLTKKGTFKVNEFSIEEQFTNADLKKLERLAMNSEGKLFYPNQMDDLESELVANERLTTIQKEESNEVQLIDWKYMLLLIVGLLSAEWFIRKYFGNI